VFRQTFEEDTPCRNIQSKATLPRAFWNGFASLDGCRFTGRFCKN
jgi:hypothetical protein